MAKFNLKEHIAKNKATFFGSLNEGQFSWMTQDTDQQIGSEDENTIPVYMFDNTGKYWFEPSYEGYGVFGGMDYYELLDQMNGGIGDRSEGVRKAFDPTLEGKLLFPALVTSPSNFNYKTHDFTKEAESDPNQSWYAEPEYDEEDEFYRGDDDYSGDDDEEELDEGKAAYEYEKGKKVGEKIEKTKMKKSELKAKIKEMIVAETNTKKVEEVDFLKEIEEMLDEDEGLTPLQDYIYQYEIEISGEDRAQEFLDDIKKLNTPQDVYDYYAYERDWSGSMDNDLENIYRQVKRKFKNLNEADEEADAEAAADAGAEEITTDTEITTDVTTDEVDPNVKSVQDALTQAQAAAQQLGDKKLMDQIGNTITFFTRAHVVEKPKGAVAENLNESMFPMLKKILK
jgi:hypothetical protein